MNRRGFLKSIIIAIAALVMPKTVRDDSSYYMPPELPPEFVRSVRDYVNKRTPEPDDGGYLLPSDVAERLLFDNDNLSKGIHPNYGGVGITIGELRDCETGEVLETYWLPVPTGL